MNPYLNLRKRLEADKCSQLYRYVALSELNYRLNKLFNREFNENTKEN